jgi:hypothetical protein
MGIITAVTDYFAAASHKCRFCLIKRKWQKADGTVAETTAFGLPKQNFITQLSRPLLTLSFVMLPMIRLTFVAAILN